MADDTLAKLSAHDESTTAECFSYVHQWLRGQPVPSEEAEQIAIDTIVTAINSADKFRGESNLNTWLVGIAHKKLLQYYKQTRTFQTCSLEEALIPENVPSETELETLMLNRMIAEEALRQLSEDERQAYVYRVVDGLSIREIADRMGRTVDSVTCLKYRAAKKISEYVRRCNEQ